MVVIVSNDFARDRSRGREREIERKRRERKTLFLFVFTAEIYRVQVRKEKLLCADRKSVV